MQGFDQYFIENVSNRPICYIKLKSSNNFLQKVQVINSFSIEGGSHRPKKSTLSGRIKVTTFIVDFNYFYLFFNWQTFLLKSI